MSEQDITSGNVGQVQNRVPTQHSNKSCHLKLQIYIERLGQLNNHCT